MTPLTVSHHPERPAPSRLPPVPRPPAPSPAAGPATTGAALAAPPAGGAAAHVAVPAALAAAATRQPRRPAARWPTRCAAPAFWATPATRERPGHEGGVAHRRPRPPGEGLLESRTVTFPGKSHHTGLDESARRCAVA